MNGRFRGTLLVAVVAFALSGCVGPAAPPDMFYRIEPAPPASRFATPPLPGVLEVERLSADGVVAERALAFAAKEGGPLGHYKYEYWSEPPGVLLQDRLSRHLAAAGAADRVVTPDIGVLADWTLRGKVRRFEQLAATGQVAVELQLSVISRSGELVLLESYGVQVPAGSDKIEAAAAAIERGVSEVFTRFVADLGRLRTGKSAQ